MILVRDIFDIRPDHMRDAKAAAKEMRAIEKSMGMQSDRLLTDLTGPYYTLVFESTYPSLGDFEKMFQAGLANEKWKPVYERFRKTIRGGRREIFQVEA